MKITIKVSRTELKDVRIELINFNVKENPFFEITKGGHINSINNWKPIIGSVTAKSSKIIDLDMTVSVSEMVNMKDSDSSKYRMSITSNEGAFIYLSSGEFNIEKSLFEEIKLSGKKAFSKMNRLQYYIK